MDIKISFALNCTNSMQLNIESMYIELHLAINKPRHLLQ